MGHKEQSGYWKKSLLLLRPHWVGTLAIMLLIGGLSWYLFPAAPGWLQRAAPAIPPDRWGRLLGIYLIAMVITHVIIHPIVLGVRLLFGAEIIEEWETPWPSALTGFCEAVLYPTSFLIGRPEFIGVWFGVKVAGNWEVWSDKEGRRIFQTFLIGNALSILFGLMTYGVIKAFVDPNLSP